MIEFLGENQKKSETDPKKGDDGVNGPWAMNIPVEKHAELNAAGCGMQESRREENAKVKVEEREARKGHNFDRGAIGKVKRGGARGDRTLVRIGFHGKCHSDA